MAETLGSLIDKLTIKSIREFYLQKMIKSGKAQFSRKSLFQKLAVVKSQKKHLLREVEDMVVLALEAKIPLRDDKVKLYNKLEQIGKIGTIGTLAQAIDALARKNMQLWQLEDEARREDVPLQYIGKIKRKIDFANQQRNDLIDTVDRLFVDKVNKHSRVRRRAK